MGGAGSILQKNICIGRVDKMNKYFVAGKIEKSKLKNTWIFGLVVTLLAGVNTASGVSNYLRNIDAFEAQSITWQAVWGQSSLLWSLVFFPIAIAIRASSLMRLEHEQGNWRRLSSYGAEIQAYRGKLVVILRFIVFSQAIFVTQVLVACIFLRFNISVADFLSIVSWGLLGVIGALTIAALQLAVSTFVSSFATTVALGVMGAISSLLITLVSKQIANLYPYAQLSWGMRSRTMAWPEVSETILYLGVNAAVMAFAVVLTQIYLTRREY